MRVVIGGAYNGKRKFVKNFLSKKETNHIFSFEGEIPKGNFSKNDIVVIGSFEILIQQYVDQQEDEIVSVVYEQLIKLEEMTNVICICTDIGRGIVPLDKNERKLRDTCGRLYQKLFSKSESICRIWYGIPQVLKGEDWI